MNGAQQKNDVRVGLSAKEVEASRLKHGSNALTQKKGKSFLCHFLSNLSDPVIRILLGALAVNLFLIFRGGDWVETAGIAVAVFLAALISTLSEHGSARAFAMLSAESENEVCRVRRDGTVREIPLIDVVVGDVVLLSAGERIAADGLLFSGDLQTDQSAMTGESREVRKLPSANRTLSPNAPSALFRGCTVTAGSGEMEVLAVGDASFLGQISHETQLEQRESPLKIRLAKLAKQISTLGYLAAILVAVAYLFNSFLLDSGMQRELILLKLASPGYLFGELFHAFTLGLTVVVVAVPEGLPMMIAVVLSSNIKKMVRDQVLVRKPVGIEAAGSMNILFTDKTGTLTEGKMTVSQCHLPSGSAMSVRELMRRGGESADLIGLTFRYCSEATVGTTFDGAPCALGGNTTERALLESILSYPAPNGFRVLSRLPFDSARKYSAVTLGGKKRLTLVIGAPERILPRVSRALLPNGSVGFFARKDVEKQIGLHTAKGERVLALAVAEDAVDAASLANGLRPALTLVATVSLCDSLRQEAA
ncbi:MAG: cation-transporting P-type ATPase, partial [Clostridia bacterium]|nr:cation-transporting P-type ATPase [Clostridia bacterium]